MSPGCWSLALVVGTAATLSAQRTPLELRPRAGDTLRIRLDQTTEMSATRAGAAPRVVITRTRMLSRAIVEREAADAVYILAVTDSVEVSSSDSNARGISEATRRQLAGRQLRLRLAPDGTVSLAEAPASKAVTDVISIMPASFPREPVAVGDSWSREMPISPGMRLPANAGTTPAGIARATFRLDSLSRSGAMAFISMHGTLERQSAGGAAPDRSPAAPVIPFLHGTVTGTMVVNRRRGWLSDSRFVVELRTTIAGATRAPTEFRMRVTQQIHVFERPARR